jgi:hypothetical protein
MRFLKAVLAGYFWATMIVAVGIAAFTWLNEQVSRPILAEAARHQRVVMLRLHFHEFFWTWCVVGMVLTFACALTCKPLVSVRVNIDNTLPPDDRVALRTY